MHASVEPPRSPVRVTSILPLLVVTTAAALRAPWRRRKPAPVAVSSEDAGVEEVSATADIQVFAHTMIADLFGAGLRLQNLLSQVPTELQGELEEIADQMDKAIRELREFAFTHRA